MSRKLGISDPMVEKPKCVWVGNTDFIASKLEELIGVRL